MAVNLNEQDLDLLIIQEVQKNPILWNTRLNEYKNTKAKEVRFLVIAEKLGLNAQDVETRWKNLRKLYVRKRKDSLGKSGATSSWPYFRYLNFLAPIVRHRNTPRKRPIVIKCSQMSQEDTDEEEDKELYEEEDKELNEEEPSEAEQASSFVHSQNLQLMCPLKNREEKNDRIMCNFLKNSEKDVVANGEEDTHNLDFFKSLLPLIRGWTNVAKIEFRTDVLGLIKRYNETQNC